MDMNTILQRAETHFSNALLFAKKGEVSLVEFYIHQCERHLAKYNGPAKSVHTMREKYDALRSVAQGNFIIQQADSAGYQESPKVVVLRR